MVLFTDLKIHYSLCSLLNYGNSPVATSSSLRLPCYYQVVVASVSTICCSCSQYFGVYWRVQRLPRNDACLMSPNFLKFLLIDGSLSYKLV